MSTKENRKIPDNLGLDGEFLFVYIFIYLFLSFQFIYLK
jgi:hypothetical protein